MNGFSKENGQVSGNQCMQQQLINCLITSNFCPRQHSGHIQVPCTYNILLLCNKIIEYLDGFKNILKYTVCMLRTKNISLKSNYCYLILTFFYSMIICLFHPNALLDIAYLTFHKVIAENRVIKIVATKLIGHMN